MKKYYRLSELKNILQKHKKQGQRIILANGCFDLIHIGHIRYLRESKERGDILIVALNSDTSVRILKGKGRPILDQKARVEILSSFEFVDYITVFDELNVETILRTIKPDVHAKGSDYTADTVPERETAQSIGIEIAITGGPKVQSTSELIRKIASQMKKSLSQS